MVSAVATRKTVSILFCDLAESTALGERLDPEPLRELLGSWYEAMRAALERHGGKVEKFVGDAVMAVFGLPWTHEDDALRAVRAAIDMQAAVERLNASLEGRGLPELRIRIGINTGEVVTGDETATLVTGDAVNTAKRLEQAAAGGEILIGAVTERLVRHAARLEAVAPVDAKGKANPVEAWRVRLLEVQEEAAPYPEPRFVGRGRELELLEEAWERVRADNRCQLVTILGEAGIGKARLVSELAARIEGQVVSGRCLSYGEGITYWPVLEGPRQPGTVPPQPDAARALPPALAREGEGELSVPASLRALLSARLDQLSPEERHLLQCAAVEGEIFHRGSLLALCPEDVHLTPRLASLVRKELLYPTGAQLPGEDAFRFRHLLLRDAAYAALPKADRASLHERFAAWAEEQSGEHDELLGYHLEQTVRYRGELGTVSERDRVQATRAAEFLGSAGGRALSRGDMPAAVDLLSRAVSLRPESDNRRLTLLPELGAALREAGELTRADEVLSEALEAGRSTGNRRGELAALIERAELRLASEPEDDADLKEVEASIPALEELGDDRALAAAWSLIGRRQGLWKGRFAQGEAALERALTYARRMGDRRQEALILGQLALSALSGPTPVDQAIARCRRLVTETGGDRLVEANVARYLAVLEAMRGNFAEARALVGEARVTYEDLGMRLMAQSAISLAYGAIGLLAADYRAAGIELRAGLNALEGMGDLGYLSSVAAFLAQALYGQGRLDEADDLARRAQASAAPDDLWSQVLSGGTRAKVCASHGAHEEAERYAREAVGLAAATDALDLHGNALVDLADTLALADRTEEAATCVADALRLYERKGNDVSAERARARLAGASVTASEGLGGRAS